MKKQIILFCVIFCMSFGANIAAAQAQNAEDPYVIIVEFTFNEKDVDKAIDLLLEMQALTLENEEGCFIYDVLLSEEDPTKIFMYENYETEAAFKAHENSTYYKTIVSGKLNPLVKGTIITKVIPLIQTDGLMDEEP